MWGDEETERRWREAVRKEKEDSKPKPYQGDYGGAGGNQGCFGSLLMLLLHGFHVAD